MAADAWRVWTGPSWLQRLSDVWGHASAWRIFWHHGPVGARSPSSPSARIPDRRIRGFNDCIESKAAVVAEPRSPYHTSGDSSGQFGWLDDRDQATVATFACDSA